MKFPFNVLQNSPFVKNIPSFGLSFMLFIALIFSYGITPFPLTIISRIFVLFCWGELFQTIEKYERFTKN